MYRSARKRIKVDYDPKMEFSEPTPIVRRSILTNSLALDFDDAKTEWILQDVTDSSDENFSDKCDICNTPHLKYNFIIYNPLTNKTLRVGSRCILRFGIIKGNVDVSTGVAILQNFADEKYYINELQTRVSGIMALTPDAKDVSEFYQMLKKLFELKGIKNPTVHQIGEICYGNKWPKISQDLMKYSRLKQIWEKPGSIETVKSKVRKETTFKEHTTFGHKRRKAVYNVGAGRSKIYQVSDEVIDQNNRE